MGDGSISFRVDKGLWLGTFHLARKADGKRVRRTMYAKSTKELQQKIADLKVRDGGTIRPRAVGTVGKFFEQWRENDVRPNRSAKTTAIDETVWRISCSPLIGGISLEKFDVDHALQMCAELRERKVSASMTRRVGVLMHIAFNVAIRRRSYNRANPFDSKDLPVHRPKVGKTLTIEQAKQFLTAARDDRFEALWVLLLTAGFRLGEALALRWTDIDFEANIVSVNRSLIEVGGDLSFGRGKTAGSRRPVVIGKLARQALLRRLAVFDTEPHDSKLVFSSLDGTPMHASNLRRRNFFTLLKSANIDSLRIHDLRHSMTSLGVYAGLQARVLADRLGHSTTRLTQDRYSHLFPASTVARPPRSTDFLQRNRNLQLAVL